MVTMRAMVRPATIDDLDAIVSVHVAGFRAGNVPYLPPEEHGRMTPERSAAGWRSVLEKPEPGTALLVSSDGEHIVGIAGGGPARDDDTGEAAGEVYVLYVDPSVWGRGHGAALDQAVRARLRRALFTDAVLWVLEENARARGFYEHRGWRADGARREHAGATALRYRVGL
jgi:GNAT superfamily N-acetyltransferase